MSMKRSLFPIFQVDVGRLKRSGAGTAPSGYPRG